VNAARKGAASAVTAVVLLAGAVLAAAPAAAAPVDTPDIGLSLDGGSGLSGGVTTVLLLGMISLIPALLLMVTAFTRIVIVLGLTRSALGTTNIPPTQVIIGFSLFLTLFVMAPTMTAINDAALQPFLDGSIEFGQAWDAALEPLRAFMFANTNEQDIGLMVKLSNTPPPATPADLPTTTLIPAFVISELRTAFLIGFIIFVPFLVIDLVVSAVLTGVGMVMLPPALVSLPFKLLLFVVADGWVLITESLVGSFNP
jgi:flagellar biosynthetic protein FliP